jgi:hypothetical protein
MILVAQGLILLQHNGMNEVSVALRNLSSNLTRRITFLFFTLPDNLNKNERGIQRFNIASNVARHQAQC